MKERDEPLIPGQSCPDCDGACGMDVDGMWIACETCHGLGIIHESVGWTLRTGSGTETP